MTSQLNRDLISLSVDGRIAVLELVAEANRNALSLEMEAAILAGLDSAREAGATVAVLRTRSRTFCSGYNVSTTGRPDYVAVKGITSDIERLEAHVDFLMKFRNHPVVTIAQIEGPCLAGGTDLVLCADIAIASDTARFALPNVRAMGITLLAAAWSLVIGPARAKLMMFTGDSLSGEQAEKWGFVALSVKAKDIESAVMEIAGRIALTPPSMLVVTKRTSNRAFETIGLGQLLRAGVELDSIGHFTDPAISFWNTAKADGLKAALKSRDGAYAGDDLSAILARYDGKGESQ